MLSVDQMRDLSQEPPRDEDYRCGHALLEAANEIARLRAALHSQLEAHYATWMAARAEVEGRATASMLFEKEPEVIEARNLMTGAR